MTRITEFGRKRTYVEASFDHDSRGNEAADAGQEVGPSPKKKRKRTKPSKKDGNTDVEAAERGEKEERLAEEGSTTLSKSAKKKKRELRKLKSRSATVSSSLSSTSTTPERHRRVRRINSKLAATTCFACREKGHAAKDCPQIKHTSNDSGKNSKSKPIVGICYRCGSTKHILSRCKKPMNDADPLPFASCFVCNGKGHLASSCPQNTAKGVYPNGGSCKLCGDTSHLAKDCGLRNKGTVHTSTIVGTGQEVGADEDDFHSFRRHNAELDREEKREEKAKRRLGVMTGAHSGIIKTFGSPPNVSTQKKVVHFF